MGALFGSLLAHFWVQNCITFARDACTIAPNDYCLNFRVNLRKIRFAITIRIWVTSVAKIMNKLTKSGQKTSNVAQIETKNLKIWQHFA